MEYSGETNSVKRVAVNGKVKLSELTPFPIELQEIFCDRIFRNNIFNLIFAFATFQADITTDRKFPLLKVEGQVHHIAPTSLYGLSTTNKSYCDQI